MPIVKYALSFAPVVLFLATLLFLDSYKLLRLRSILLALGAGVVVAGLCFILNTGLLHLLHMRFETYTHYCAPVVEEFCKALVVYWFIRSNRLGFIIDAAIVGFAVGAGFAVSENLYYLIQVHESNLLIWLIRGFGTAMMHGGSTAIFAMLSKNFIDRRPQSRVVVFLPGLTAAILIHSAFNQFFLPPVWTTLAQVVVLPLLMMAVFSRSEKQIQQWLELGLDTDVTLMESITTGRISETKIGAYLGTLKSKFSGAMLADMLCLLRLQLELSIRAKGILLMRNAGFAVEPDAEVKEKFNELKFLEKSIGQTGKLALMPILRTSTRDLWQFYFLQK